MTHYNTFRDQLSIAHPAFGYALWEPDPGEQYPPVEVGDVGFVRQGKFHRLFNALLPANHQSHQRFGVPEHYEPLQLSVPDHIDHGTLHPNIFCSHGVRVESGDSGLFAVAPPTSDSAEVSFSCPRKDGAALSLPVVARRKDTLSQAHFGRWMTKNIDSLFALSQRHGLGVEMEDIVLVTGCHRTRSWSNMAFYESQADSRVSLSVQTPSTDGTTVHWRVLSRGMQGAVLNHGPSGENLPDSQCLFIRGFRVKRILWIIPRLKGAAGSQPDLGGHEYEPEMELVSIPSITEYRDPLHVLLEYIATRAPDCDMALVHDDDLVRILQGSDGTSLETLRPDVVMEYLQRSKLAIGVMPDSWTANNESPRTDTECKTVAMLSERLHSLCPPASVPLLPGNTMDTKEITDDDALGDRSRKLSVSDSVTTESKISVDDIANIPERFLSVGPSGVNKSSLISGVSQGVSGISNSGASQYKHVEPDAQREFSRAGVSGGGDEARRTRAKMRPTNDSERQASLPTNRITVGLPRSEDFVVPSSRSDPETSGSGAEPLTSGTSYDPAFDPRKESHVTGTESRYNVLRRLKYAGKRLFRLRRSPVSSDVGQRTSDLEAEIRDESDEAAKKIKTAERDAASRAHQSGLSSITEHETAIDDTTKIAEDIPTSTTNSIAANAGYTPSFPTNPASADPNVSKAHQTDPFTSIIPAFEPETDIDDIIQTVERFRILSVGRPGVGKSSLINRVFGIDAAQVEHRRLGASDIRQEFMSPQNQYVVLHDSQGFEPGDLSNFEAVSKFVQKQSGPELPLSERIHGLWLCTETPTAGGRVFETGDEKLLQFAHKYLVPLVIVFTQYDRLVRTKEAELREDYPYMDPDRLRELSLKDAQEAFEICLQSVQRSMNRLRIPMPRHAKVSVLPGHREDISDLVRVTRDIVKEKVKGDAWMLWEMAQRASLPLKMEACVTKAISHYQRALTAGYTPGMGPLLLCHCLINVHRDIIACWNFKGENLNGPEFRQLMLFLVQDIYTKTSVSSPPCVDVINQFVTLVTSASAPILPPVAILGLTDVFVQWLSTAAVENVPSVQRLIIAYTMDLIHVLRELFDITLRPELVLSITWMEIREAFEAYERSGSRQRIHRNICSQIAGDEKTLTADDISQKIRGLLQE